MLVNSEMKVNKIESVLVLSRPGQLAACIPWVQLLLMMAAVLLSCNRGDSEINRTESASSESSVSSSPQSADSLERFEALFRGTIYESLDFEGVDGYEEIEALNHEWNGASSDWTKLFFSSAETGEFQDFEGGSKPGIVEMERIVRALKLEVAKVPEGEYRELVEEENLGIKERYLEAYHGIHLAVLESDFGTMLFLLAQFDEMSAREEKFDYFVIEKMKEAVLINSELSSFFEAKIIEAEDLASILYSK